jgi:hypothetical protein
MAVTGVSTSLRRQFAAIGHIECYGDSSLIDNQRPEACDLRRVELSMVSGVSAMDDPKQLINRFVVELWNERRLEVADAIFARDCVTHQLRSGAAFICLNLVVEVY